MFYLFLKLFILFLYFDFLLKMHTSKQWFAYQYWYVYHGLRTHALEIQQDATDAGIYYCKLTLNVSGVYQPHCHAYIKL